MKEASVDYNLATLFLSGDVHAWEQLYSKSIKIVTGYTQKNLWGFGLIFILDDVVSEAYSRAYRKLSTFRGSSRFSTWVCGFAKRIIWEENRKDIQRKQVFQNNAFAPSALYSRDPCDIVLESELHQSLWNALAKLHPTYANILKSHIIYEWTFFELSKTTGFPLLTVKELYQNALCEFSNFFHEIHHRHTRN